MRNSIVAFPMEIPAFFNPWTEDLETLNRFYVDYSGMLKSLKESSDRIRVITAPAGFGKSSSMAILYNELQSIENQSTRVAAFREEDFLIFSETSFLESLIWAASGQQGARKFAVNPEGIDGALKDLKDICESGEVIFFIENLGSLLEQIYPKSLPLENIFSILIDEIPNIKFVCSLIPSNDLLLKKWLQDCELFEIPKPTATDCWEIAQKRLGNNIDNSHYENIAFLGVLSGFVPRIFCILVRAYEKGDEKFNPLELLKRQVLDQLTPIYLEKLQKLSRLQQRIVTFLAVDLNPAEFNIAHLEDGLGADSKSITGQLSKLVSFGVLRKTISKAKRGRYEVAEPLMALCLKYRYSTGANVNDSIENQVEALFSFNKTGGGRLTLIGDEELALSCSSAGMKDSVIWCAINEILENPSLSVDDVVELCEGNQNDVLKECPYEKDFIIAEVLRRKANYLSAIRYYRTYINSCRDANVECPIAIHNCGVCYAYSGDSRAIGMFEKVILIDDDNDCKRIQNKAYAYAHLHQWRDADRTLKKLFEHPSFKEKPTQTPYQAHGGILYRIGDSNAGLESIGRALRLYLGNGGKSASRIRGYRRARYIEGLLLGLTGLTDPAIESIEMALCGDESFKLIGLSKLNETDDPGIYFRMLTNLSLLKYEKSLLLPKGYSQVLEEDSSKYFSHALKECAIDGGDWRASARLSVLRNILMRWIDRSSNQVDSTDIEPQIRFIFNQFVTFSNGREGDKDILLRALSSGLARSLLVFRSSKFCSVSHLEVWKDTWKSVVFGHKDPALHRAFATTFNVLTAGISYLSNSDRELADDSLTHFERILFFEVFQDFCFSVKGIHS